MKSDDRKTPFVYGRVAIGPNFTDREVEAKKLRENLSSGINTVLISPRRWGKSSLVNRVAERMKSKKVCFCFIDLFNVRSAHEFYELYTKELLQVTAGRLEERMKQAGQLFKKIVPRFQFSPDPHSDFSVSLDWNELKRNEDDVLNLPERIFNLKKKRIIVCLDEFQNIAHFDDPLAFQKKLRAHWQRHQNTTYCIYGSKRHMLAEFFTSSSMPFYKFGDLVFLDKIPREYWLKFIPKRFSDTGKTISETLAGEIADTMDNHPYFVQQFAQQVWIRTPKRCTGSIVRDTLEMLLDQFAILFQKEVDQLTNMQLKLLNALCNNESSVTKGDVIRRYNLRSTAHVVKIRTVLESKEIIDTFGDKTIFIDPLLKLWLRKRFFSNQKVTKSSSATS